MFDKKTGTMQPVEQVQKESEKPSGIPKIIEQRSFPKERSVNVTPRFGSLRVDDDKMKKLEEYAHELGLEGILLFRSDIDYTICQIVDERTGRPFAYIGGYALNIKFNMEELNTIAKVEQCLEGIKKLFRSFIVEQAIESK